MKNRHHHSKKSAKLSGAEHNDCPDLKTSEQKGKSEGRGISCGMVQVVVIY
jgi:hypothetical protein